MKNKFDVVDMIKIEEYIKTLNKEKISLTENLTEKLNIDRKFYNKVNLYFVKAIQIPYDKILEKLYEYDKSSPKYLKIQSPAPSPFLFSSQYKAQKKEVK